MKLFSIFSLMLFTFIRFYPVSSEQFKRTNCDRRLSDESPHNNSIKKNLSGQPNGNTKSLALTKPKDYTQIKRKPLSSSPATPSSFAGLDPRSKKKDPTKP